MVWAASHVYELLGTRFRVQSEDAGLIEGLDRLLKPFRSDDERATRARDTYALVDGERMKSRSDGLLVYRDCKLIGTGSDAGAAIASLLTSLNRAAVADTELFAAHAGVVSVGDTAIALPAESGHGKSTLTAACLRAGFDYASDEAICVDVTTGDLLPYPKPLGLSEWSRGMLDIDDSTLTFPTGSDEGFVTAEDLGSTISASPLRLRHVVIAEFGHEEAKLEEIPGSQAMKVLLEMSFNHYKFGADAFQLAASLANRSTTWRLSYDNPLEAGELLKERLGSR